MAKDWIAYWMARGETAERAAYLAKGSEELAAEVAEQIEAKLLRDSAQACLYSSPACTENYLSARCAA